MELQEALETYQACPYTRLSMDDVCEGCRLSQGFIIESPGGEGGQLHTTICRLIEVMEDTLAMINEHTGP